MWLDKVHLIQSINNLLLGLLVAGAAGLILFLWVFFRGKKK